MDRQLGKYHIIEEIGRGGFAAVYRAVDTELDRQVALKVLAPHLLWDPTFIERFRREAKAMASLNHPHIATLYDYGEQEGSYYLVLEYVPGETLRQLVEREGPLPLEQVTSILKQVAAGLDYAHGQGVIHRDVKSSNVLLTPDGTAKLTDFGLVKVVAETSTLSSLGQSAGTPEYMAPEQFEEQEVGAPTDLYSLGVVLYEMCTGALPFTGPTPLAVMRGVVDKPPPDPTEVNPSLPPAVASVLLKALAKKPQNRYGSAGELAAALDESASHDLDRREAPAPRQSPGAEGRERQGLTEGMGIRRFPWMPMFGAILVLVVIASVVWGVRSCRVQPTPVVIEKVVKETVLVEVTQAAEEPAEVTPTPTDTKTPTNTPTDTPVPPTPTPVEPVAGATRVWDDGSIMVYVPADEFTMGSPEGEGGDDEDPQHTVYVSGFWMDQTEVTNERFARFVDADNYTTDADRDGWGMGWTGSEWQKIEGANWRHPDGPETSIADKMDHPVVQVSWADAQAYCQWAGKRLPTEAEWEKGARGTEGRKYPWGDTFDSSRLNFCDVHCEFGHGDPNADDGYARTAPVGNYPAGASPYGAQDMAGNVWEWCQDWYDADYDVGPPHHDPIGPDSGWGRVLRGGSWDNHEQDVRTADRHTNDPHDRYNSVGFRCVAPTQ